MSKNTIVQLLVKNQEYLNKSVCNRKTVLNETFKTVPKGPLKQSNNTETFRINCSNRFEVLPTTDDNEDDDNDRKCEKSENNTTEEFLTNDDVMNRTKIQKSCITNRKYKNNALPKKNDTQRDHNRRESMKAVRRTNNIIKDHHENLLNVNRMTSTYSNVVRNKKKNIVLFTDSILKTYIWAN